MRQFNILSVLLLVLVVGCTNGEKNSVRNEDSVLSENQDSPVSDSLVIVPGKSIGNVFLGQDITDVSKELGDVDDGDAAMGKAWGIWHLRDSSDAEGLVTLSVYSSYKDTSMMAKDVKQIVITGGDYSTVDGLKNGVLLETIKAKLPDLKKVAVYVNAAGTDTLQVYDSEKNGIAFDLKKLDQQLISNSITVHQKGISVNSTYLTIHPGWKLLN